MSTGLLQAQADIREMQGKIRGHPVAMSGLVTWHDQGADIKEMILKSEQSKVELNGRISDSSSLKWRVDTQDLHDLHPQLNGEFIASGMLRGSFRTPLIDADINAAHLHGQNYQIGKLTGSISLELFTWRSLGAQIYAQELSSAGVELRSAWIEISGNDQRQVIDIKTDAIQGMIAAQAVGSMAGGSWTGNIQKFNVAPGNMPDWKLKQPAEINISAKSLLLGIMCINSEGSELCLTANRVEQNWTGAITAKDFSLSNLSPWMPSALHMDGKANGNVDVTYHAGDKVLSGKVRLNMAEGAIYHAAFEGGENKIDYRNSYFEAVLSEAGITASTEIILNNGDLIQADAVLPSAQLLKLNTETQTIKANMRIQANDLALLEALLPEIQELQGRIRLNMNTEGTLAQPLLSGNAYLENGDMRIPRLGLHITKMYLQAYADKSGKLKYTLGANSGDGNLKITGQTFVSNGWRTQISIVGSNLLVSNIPEAQISASPNIQIDLHDKTLNVAGEVFIPTAKLQPKDVTNAVTPSNDVQIVGISQPVQDAWNITSRIRLKLGERIKFNGYGFEGIVTGNLLMVDEPGQLTKATGELNVVEGRYTAYGQKLAIEQGRVVYTGGLLSNPGLDLLAVRKVETITAGFRVRGTLHQPSITLFSDPALGQTDILSYILFGRPIEGASTEEGTMLSKVSMAIGLSGMDRLARSLGDKVGLEDIRIESSDTGTQASLLVGRYLSPRLYIGYGVGLIESANTMFLNYRLSEHWQLKAESGEHQGADLLYTIER